MRAAPTTPLLAPGRPPTETYSPQRAVWTAGPTPARAANFVYTREEPISSPYFLAHSTLTLRKGEMLLRASVAALSLHLGAPGLVGSRAAGSQLYVSMSAQQTGVRSLSPACTWRLALDLTPPVEEGSAPSSEAEEGVTLTATVRFAEEAGFEPPQGLLRVESSLPEGQLRLGEMATRWTLSEGVQPIGRAPQLATRVAASHSARALIHTSPAAHCTALCMSRQKRTERLRRPPPLYLRLFPTASFSTLLQTPTIGRTRSGSGVSSRSHSIPSSCSSLNARRLSSPTAPRYPRGRSTYRYLVKISLKIRI